MPTPIAIEEHRIAIAVDDVLRMEPLLRSNLVGGRLSKTHVRIEQGDSRVAAVEFTCPAIEAAAICDVIRDQDRDAEESPSRVYVWRGKTWSRVPADVELVVGEFAAGEQPVLNPKLFGRTVDATEAVEPESQDQLFPTADVPDEGLVQADRGDSLAVDGNVTFGDGNTIGEERAMEAWVPHDPSMPEPLARGRVPKTPQEVRERKPRTKPQIALPLPIAKTYAEHHDRWKNCQRCPLGKQRQEIVLARGQLPCDVLYCAEAPGLSEDDCGSPLVGPSGDRIDEIDRRAFRKWPHLRRAFCNLVACYPREAKAAGIGVPDGEEIEACAERLREFVSLARPRLVVFVGSLATKWWPRSVPEYFWKCQTTHIYHPAAIMRMPELQRDQEYQRSQMTIERAVRQMENPAPAADAVVQ